MGLLDLSINSNDDTARFFERLVRPLTREGAAVLLLDHVTKDAASRGRHAIGAQHKLAAIDGACYSLERVAPFGHGRSGSSRLVLQKDRPGWVARTPLQATKETVASVYFNVYSDGFEVVITSPGCVSHRAHVVARADTAGEDQSDHRT